MISVGRALTAWATFLRGVPLRRWGGMVAAVLLLLSAVGMEGSCPAVTAEGSEEVFGEVHWYSAEWAQEQGTS